MTSPHYVGDYLTCSQAAEILGVSLRAIQLWSNNGSLPCFRTPGGHRRFSRQVIQEMATRMKNAGAVSPAEDRTRLEHDADAWVLVPKQPTAEMLEAAEEAGEQATTGTWWVEPSAAYTAMLKAAPAPSASLLRPLGWVSPNGPGYSFSFNPEVRLSFAPNSAWPADARVPLYAQPALAHSASPMPTPSDLLASIAHSLIYVVENDGTHRLALVNNDPTVSDTRSQLSPPRNKIDLYLTLTQPDTAAPVMSIYLTYPKLVANPGKYPVEKDSLSVTITITSRA